MLGWPAAEPAAPAELAEPPQPASVTHAPATTVMTSPATLDDGMMLPPLKPELGKGGAE
jgi:hypothetical protein